MQNQVSAITSLYEGGLTIEQIAQDQELEVVSVKAALLQGSEQYRKETAGIQAEGGSAFSSSEEELARKTIVELMTCSEVDNVRFRCARYLRDDHKGRLDANKLGKLNINVALFTETIQRAEHAKEKGRTKCTDIPTVVVPNVPLVEKNSVRDTVEV
jgi:hypothetical protein